MIWLLRPDQPKATESAPALDEGTGIVPGLPPVAGKPVPLAFDSGQMTSDTGILRLAAIEQRLRIAERLADCIEDPRAGTGAAYARRDDPLPGLADRGGLSQSLPRPQSLPR